MDKAAYIVLKECMNLKTNEKFLVVYDKNKENIANVFLKKAEKIAKNADKIRIGKEGGEKPSKSI